MTNKMSLCIIKYTYTQYVGVDIEKYTRGLFEYVKEAFGEFRPQMSEPGTIPDMPDYLDILLCKKDGSIFYEMDIQRRAINIPLDFQMEGLVLEIDITNCDGTKYKKMLCKKDGSIFYEMDIQRRAINIPLDFQMEGLVLEIDITNCDGTKYKKTHQFLK